MNVKIYTEPTIEPITLAELKMHLRLDSGSVADNIDQVQSIAPGLKAFVDDWTTHAGTGVDVLGYSAVVSFITGAFSAGGTVDVKIQESDDNITFTDWGTQFLQVTTDGMVSSAALAVGTTPANIANGIFSYFVDELGVPYSKPAFAAGTAPGNDVIPMGKYGAVALDIGGDNTIDVIEAPGNAAGYDSAALATAALPASAASHVRMGSVTVTKSDGAFTFGTTALNAANVTTVFTQATLIAYHRQTFEMAYTGTKQYIRAVAKVLVADCSFAVIVIRVSGSVYEDDQLNDIIKEAREHVEDITRRQIMTATWDYYLDEFPHRKFIKLPFGNLQSVTSITYKDSEGTATTMTVTTEYLVETNGEGIGRIVLPYGVSWPSPSTYYPSNPITIRFVCGWTTQALVPSRIKAAIKLICADLYEMRGEPVIGQSVVENKAVHRLLASCRLWDEF